jgi:hypothetical protein
VKFDFSFACAAISNASSVTSNEIVSSTVSIEMIAGFIHFTPSMIPGITRWCFAARFFSEVSDIVGARGLHAWDRLVCPPSQLDLACA